MLYHLSSHSQINTVQHALLRWLCASRTWWSRWSPVIQQPTWSSQSTNVFSLVFALSALFVYVVSTFNTELISNNEFEEMKIPLIPSIFTFFPIENRQKCQKSRIRIEMNVLDAFP